MSKVLLINDFYLGGGAEGVCRDTYQLLKQKGVQVDFFYGKKESCHPKSFASYLYNKNSKKELEQKLATFKPSVIHIHNYYHYLSSSIFVAIKKYKKKHAVKVVFTAHDYHLICANSGMTTFNANNNVVPIALENNSFVNLLFKKIDYRGVKYSLVKKIHWFWSVKIINPFAVIDQMVSPSNFLKKAFKVSGVKQNIAVVRNPFNHLKSEENFKPLTQDQIKMVFIGRLSQEKGLLAFLQAYQKIKHNFTNVTVDVLGTGLMEKELKDYVVAQNLSSVKFHGHKNKQEVISFLKNSNVLLLPSVWYENAPLSIIEGASYGNIILTTNMGGMKELAELTKHAVLVTNWNKDLNKAIKQISKCKGNNAVLHTQEFDASNYVKKLIELYK